MHRSLIAAILAAAALLATPAIAGADSSSTLTVIGTSDVSDSGLMQNVVQPMFMAKYPQFTFKYIGTATGTAIASAETGTDGASALIVHAASLENQFVGDGFSYQNKYGYAIWINDFVLAGPGGDPAGVSSNGAHNIVQAFADVAGAGMAGKATFVSRGGTPGTTVEEHEIWALVASSKLAPRRPRSVRGKRCTWRRRDADRFERRRARRLPVPEQCAADRLGAAVVVRDDRTDPGPQRDCGQRMHLLHWRQHVLRPHRPGHLRLPRVGAGSRGVGSSAEDSDLAVLQDDKGTPGGVNALINYFHAYMINPSKVPNVNLTAAQDFVNMLTSPALQSKLKNYLNHTVTRAGRRSSPAPRRC